MGCEDHVPRTLVIASGYFDPLHVGHAEYLEKAKALGDKLLVIVNSDVQARQKKGYTFMPEKERMKIVNALKPVDEVMLSIDENPSVCLSITAVYNRNKNNYGLFIFGKGGDRTKDNIPEAQVCYDYGINIVSYLGDKIQSSSDLVKRIASD